MPAPCGPTGKAKSAAPKGAALLLTDALAKAAWADADHALAQALAEYERVEAATDQVRRAEALLLLRQALARAARLRGFSRSGGEPGAIEKYDPKRHDLTRTPAQPPAEIMIVAQGVARGGDVLVKALAKPLRRRPQ